MFKSKTLKQIVFLTLMCLSAILLCLVGVYAVSTYNLKSYSYVAPDILCKLEYKEGNSSSTNSYTTILDNYNKTNNAYLALNSNITLTCTSVANTITFQLINYTSDKHIRVKLTDVTINNASYNYNELTSICCDESTDLSTPNSNIQEWIITPQVTSSSSSPYELSFNIVIEEVHKITVSGTGLSNSGTSYYFTSTETPEITLTPTLGYQLPQSVTSSNSCCSTYSTANNSNGTATFSSITADQTLTCNCEKVFTIYKNNATSMFNNATTSGGITSQTYTTSDITSFLPNNGCYTSSTSGDNTTFSTNTVTSNVYLPISKTFDTSEYTGYQSHSIDNNIYWISGTSTVQVNSSSSYYFQYRDQNDAYQYQQTADYDSTTYSNYTYYNDNSDYGKAFYIQDSSDASKYNMIPYNQLYYKYTITCENFQEYKYYIEMGYYPQSLSYYSEVPISSGGFEDFTAVSGKTNYYTYNGNTYVYSAINVITNSIGLGNNGTTTTGYGMFKLEPIVWTVVGAKTSSGTSQDLDSLYYSNNMLYTDATCGKPFTGQLELLSAYGLDTTRFRESNSLHADYSASLINTLLNDNNSTDFYNYNKIFTNSHLFDLTGNYLKQSTVTTYEADTNDGVYYVSTNAGMFLLSLGKNDTYDYSTRSENFAYSNYFKNRNGETGEGTSYSLSVTSLSDFAIARGAENGYHQDKTTSTMGQYAISMGWSCGSSNISHQNISSCAYWLRTAAGANSTSAYLINLNGVTVTTNSADSNICLRPFTVLDLGYYYNSSADNKFYNPYSAT